jgi:predicted pyridoxine 5'-phosphate oxidase superfamily flavin-nucleotide-binding protein
MSDLYHSEHRQLQKRFDTVKLATRMENDLVQGDITADDKAFIEGLDMFFLATTDQRGRVNCSYRGGAPGFVRVVDARTIAFPNYDGNGMYLSMGNVAQTAEVGLLFIDFEQQARMRLNGTATIHYDDPLLGEYPEAQFIVRVTVRELFTNCRRYIHKMQRVARSRFVPKAGCATPVPRWKTGDWVKDALPATDPARDPSKEALDR